MLGNRVDVIGKRDNEEVFRLNRKTMQRPVVSTYSEKKGLSYSSH